MAYDIREPKRLRAVHAVMKGFGYALQYSVFICDLDAMEKIGLRSSVGAKMNHHEDSLVLVDLGDPETRGVECFEFMGQRPALPKGGAIVV